MDSTAAVKFDAVSLASPVLVFPSPQLIVAKCRTPAWSPAS
jgi:hypothetical protein